MIVKGATGVYVCSRFHKSYKISITVEELRCTITHILVYIDALMLLILQNWIWRVIHQIAVLIKWEIHLVHDSADRDMDCISDNELSTVNLTLWLWFCCDPILLNLNYLYLLQGYEDEHLHPDYYRLMLQEQCRLWLNTEKTDCYTQISGDGAKYAVFINKSTGHVLIKK